MTSGTEPVPLDEFARTLAPHLDIVSISQPVPALHARNVVLVTDTAEHARAAVLELEGFERDDAKLGTVVMGRAGDAAAAAVGDGVDPQGVSGVVLPRVAAGAAIGGVVGAVLGAVIAAVLDMGAGVWAAALGGAALFAVLGAIWTVFAGLGGSDAYRQSFVDEDVTDLSIVSLHTDDDGLVATAWARLDDHPHIALFEVNADGHPTEQRS